MQPDVRPVIEPAVELTLEIELVRERPPRLETRLHIPLQPLDDALRLTVPRVKDTPADRQLPTERGELPGRPATTGVQAPLTVGDQPLGQRADPLKAAPHPPQHVRRLLGEHQRARAEPCIAQHPDNDIPLTRLAVADRDLELRLPQIELDQITRPIHRPLIRPLIDKERADLPHVAIGDRLAALIPQRLQDLPDPLTLDLSVAAQQLVDLLPEPVELRPPRRPRIRRRRRRAQRPTDRLAMQPRPPPDLPDRQPLNQPHPTDLRPLLHADHPILPASIDDDRARLRTQPDDTARPRVGQFSTGVGGPVSSRRRHVRRTGRTDAVAKRRSRNGQHALATERAPRPPSQRCLIRRRRPRYPATAFNSPTARAGEPEFGGPHRSLGYLFRNGAA